MTTSFMTTLLVSTNLCLTNCSFSLQLRVNESSSSSCEEEVICCQLPGYFLISNPLRAIRDDPTRPAAAAAAVALITYHHTDITPVLPVSPLFKHFGICRYLNAGHFLLPVRSQNHPTGTHSEAHLEAIRCFFRQPQEKKNDIKKAEFNVTYMTYYNTQE